MAKKQSCELKKGGQVVGVTDRVYPITGSEVTFDEVVVRGNLSGILEYNGRMLRITLVDAFIGLLVDMKGPRGPVWKGVVCQVLNEEGK